eukprot:2085437-Pyramimonas_sp.AAC.1
MRQPHIGLKPPSQQQHTDNIESPASTPQNVITDAHASPGQLVARGLVVPSKNFSPGPFASVSQSQTFQ